MSKLKRANSDPRDSGDKDDIQLAPIPSEAADEDFSPASYSIFTYPADFTLEVLVDKWRKGDIIIPRFQRRFVWTPTQSSRLIESFLHGLPVPPIFLFNDPENKLLVVDGQQRLKTIAYFFEGLFGEDSSGKRKVFRLSGLNSASEFLGKTYGDLEVSDVADFNRLNNAVLRSFVIRQVNPDDDTSIYHIFERLNTGGTFLRGQEIRNCIYHGGFNDLLIRLNKPEEKVAPEFAESVKKWREILGKPKADKRFRDVELILRFFALHFDARSYKPPMKEFLNSYMRRNKNATSDKLQSHQDIFQKTVSAVHGAIGAKPFHIEAGLNIAVFDAVFVTFADNLDRIPRNIADRFDRLKEDKNFRIYVTAATTNEEVVANRLELTRKTLFGK